MIKLDYIIPANNFTPAIERWNIEPDVRIDITKAEKIASVTFWSKSGDITDQIYDRLKTQDYFKELKLVSTSCYSIDIPIEKLDKLLKYVEAMDKSQLKEGKKY